MVVWERYEGDTLSKRQQGTSKKPHYPWLPWPCWCRTLQIHRWSYKPQETKRWQKHFWVGLLQYCIWLILASSSQLLQSDSKRSNIIQVYKLPWAILEPHRKCPCLFEVASDCQKKKPHSGPGTSLALRVTRCFTTSKVPQSPKDLVFLFFGDEKQRCKSWTGDVILDIWTDNCVRVTLACHEINFIQFCFWAVENFYALQSSTEL